MKTDNPDHDAKAGGMNAAMLFPRRIFPSVVGVARSGSRLFSTFSPTMAYEAIALGSVTCLRNQATQHPHCGRLSSPVWSKETENLAVVNIQSKIFDGSESAEFSCQIFSFNHLFLPEGLFLAMFSIPF
jgi:hypothetical protein